MAAQQHKLKKRLRELKRLRTAVITGDEKKYTLDQVNDAILKVRKTLKGDVANRISMDEYLERRIEGECHIEIAQDLEITAKDLRNFVEQFRTKSNMDQYIKRQRAKLEEEKGMAKITVEQYKEFTAQGLKVKDIAKTTGVSEASVYQYKSKWKKEGLLDAPVTTPVEKVTVVKPSELDRLTQINADLGSQHELLKAKNAELVEKNRLLTEKLNVIAKCDEKATEIQRLKQQLHDAKTAYEHTSDRNAELNEQMDELEEQYNALKERYETLQGIASGYEHHEKELHEQADTLAIELENAHEENQRLRNEIKSTLATIENDKKHDVNREMHLLLLADYTQRLKA